MLVASLLVALLASASAPPAAPSAAVRERVRALLGVIDRPVSPEAIRAAGPGADEALAEIALSRDLPIRRGRALEVLATFGGARAEEVHRRVLGDRAAPRAVRRSAVNGLGVLLPAGRVERALRPVLERDGDGAVRAAAAEVLSRGAPAGPCAAIRAQLRREQPGDRGRFTRALAACDR